jgi:hypothetical protein
MGLARQEDRACIQCKSNSEQAATEPLLQQIQTAEHATAQDRPCRVIIAVVFNRSLGLVFKHPAWSSSRELFSTCVHTNHLPGDIASMHMAALPQWQA